MAESGSLKAVLWDLDGTILDSREEHFSANQQAFKEFGIAAPKWNTKEYFGKTAAEIIGKLAGDLLTEEELKNLIRRRDEIYRSIISKNAVFLPGVERWLKQFQDLGLIQAIASSTAYQNIETILKALNGANFFNKIFSGAMIPSKPAPAIFNVASAELSVKPACCLVIEDSPFGVSAARSAGMRCLAVTNTNNAEDLSGADIILSSLAELKMQDIHNLFK